MKVFRADEVPSAQTNGTAETRLYYESPEQGFRIVVTTIPPGHTQNEHRHVYLLDIIYVLEGQVQVSERSDGILLEETLGEGDMVCFAPSVTMQGGASPESIIIHHPATRQADFDAVTAAIVSLAGFFTYQALQLPPPGLPTLRQFQAAQGEVARDWVAQRLGWN